MVSGDDTYLKFWVNRPPLELKAKLSAIGRQPDEPYHWLSAKR